MLRGRTFCGTGTVIGLALTLLLTMPGSDAKAQTSQRRPNIVFVLVDDMGYGDLGCYGGTDIRTPNIDRLASEGVKFTDFYANAPVCSPTRCAFVTGRWQQRSGFEWAMGYTAEQAWFRDGQWVNEPDMHAMGLPTTEPSIAKMLGGAGYATGCFGKWHLGYKPEYSPIRHGFDEYFGTLLGHADYYRYNYFDGTYQLRDGENVVQADGYLTDLLNQRAVEFVRKNAEKPFFLYVPHLALHAPYQPPGRPDPPVSQEGMNVGDRQALAAMLEKVDEGVGMLLDELDKLQLTENTLFVLSSDNGGAHYSDNSPMFSGKQTLWEGGIRVACLMRWPGQLPAGAVTGQPAITMDLTATFAALAGATPSTERPMDGIDLLPILRGQQPKQERTLCWRVDHSSRQQKAIRHGKWKYVFDGGYVHLLFDLENDPSERTNHVIHQPQVVRDLQQRLQAWEADVDAGEKTFIVR